MGIANSNKQTPLTGGDIVFEGLPPQQGPPLEYRREIADHMFQTSAKAIREAHALSVDKKPLHEKEAIVKEKIVDMLVSLKEGSNGATGVGEHEMVDLFSNMITKEKLYLTADQALKQVQDEIRKGLKSL